MTGDADAFAGLHLQYPHAPWAMFEGQDSFVLPMLGLWFKDLGFRVLGLGFRVSWSPVDSISSSGRPATELIAIASVIIGIAYCAGWLF